MKVISKEIEMIVYFDTDGSIKPIKFRIEEEDTYKVIKIEKIVSTQLENKTIIFNCISLIGEREKTFEVKFNIEDCTWVLWKI